MTSDLFGTEPAASIPRRLRDITAEWVNHALRDWTPDFGVVASVAAEQISRGSGFAGRAYRLRLEWDSPAEGQPSTLVAKLPSADATIRAEIAQIRSQELEMSFFAHLARDTRMRVPRCYWCVYESDTHDAAFLLEDLGAWRFPDQAAACTAEETALIVRSLATMHAGWWQHARLSRANWLLPLAGDTTAAWQQWCIAGWDAFLDEHREWLPREFAPLGAAIGPQLLELARQASAGASTLVHGDFRLENMAFAPPGAPDPLVVYDWQQIAFGAGAFDLAYFLAQSVDAELRRAHERELVRLYHQTLCANGVRGYSHARCWDDYRRGLLSAFRLPVNGARALAGVDLERLGEQHGAAARAHWERARSLLATMARRNVDAILDTDAAALLPAED